MIRPRVPLGFLGFGLLLLCSLETALRVLEPLGLAQFSSEGGVYPDHPERYVKIAVVGESPAAGFAATRPFADIVSKELESAYPGKRFFLKNYASLGLSFHGCESELTMRLIERYDYILIYSGLSEFRLHLAEAGLTATVGGSPEDRCEQLDDNTLGNRIASHFRTVPFLHWLRHWRYENLIAHPSADFVLGPSIPGLTELHAPIFSASIRDRMAADFAADMRAIAALAQRRGKHVLASAVILNEPWRPFFSSHRAGLSDADRHEFDEKLKKGAASLAAGHDAAAVRYLMQACAIDPEVSILDNLMGRALWDLGDRREARRHFVSSIIEDGLPFRYSALLNGEIKAADSSANPYFRYIDANADLDPLLARGYAYDELFSDMEHPNLTGHEFLAREFLCAIAQSMPVAPRPEEACADWRSADLRFLSDRERMRLGVTDQEQADVDMTNAVWHYREAGLSAYPADFLVVADQHLERFRQHSTKSDENRVRWMLGKALVRARQGDATVETARLLNDAMSLSPEYVERQLESDAGDGRTIRELLAEAGVKLDADNRVFEAASPPPS
jgi:hypothetical protein